MEIEAAKQILFERESYELEGQRVRYKALQLSQKFKMTKYHFKQAEKQHDTTIMNQILDPSDNLIKRRQEDIEQVLSSYWANIMRKKDTNCIPGIITSTQVVIESIKKTLPEASRIESIELGQGTDPIYHDNEADQGIIQFLSTETIYESIKSSKLNKAPGIDGLPIEFYDAFLRILRPQYYCSYKKSLFVLIK